jgi:hypothetical protein
MAYLILPNFPTSGRHEYDIELGGETFTLDFTYDERVQSWYMDIRDASNVVIRSGVRLVADFPLLSRSKLDTLPEGALLAIDITGQGKDIEAQEELGDRVQLVFVPDSDIPEPLDTDTIVRTNVVTPP